MNVRTWPVETSLGAALHGFVVNALRLSGAEILHSTPHNAAPFLVSYESRLLPRAGLVCYAFPLEAHRSAPDACFRFFIRSGRTRGRQREFPSDPFGLFTTIVVGIDLTRGFFIGVDPVLQDPALLPRTVVVSTTATHEIVQHGWHAWEREGWEAVPFGFAEVLVGATSRHFVRLVELERLAVGLDQGHRQLLAEELTPGLRSQHRLGRIADSPASQLHRIDRKRPGRS